MTLKGNGLLTKFSVILKHLRIEREEEAHTANRVDCPAGI